MVVMAAVTFLPKLPPVGHPEHEPNLRAWLLEVLPAARSHQVCHRHLPVLLMLARDHIDGCIIGARQTYSSLRAELSEVVPPETVASALIAVAEIGAELVAMQELIGEMLLAHGLAED